MIGNPFASKLTFHQRCFIYAAHWARQYSYQILGRAFGVNAETVAKICRAGQNDSRHYKNIFAVHEAMGAERMYQAYTTPELERLIEDAKQKRAEQMRIYSPAKFYEYMDQGEGAYYLKNYKGDIVYVPLKFAHTIRKTTPNFEASAGEGVYYKDSQFGWSTMIDPTWESIGDALRYFAAFPRSLDDQKMMGTPD